MQLLRIIGQKPTLPFVFSSVVVLILAGTVANSHAHAADQTNKSQDGWVDMFNGRDLDGWRPKRPPGRWRVVGEVSLDPQDNKNFSAAAGTGTLLNGKNGHDTDLFSKIEHGDIEAHIEFNMAPGSNSGIYFQGRYEIQILDSYGKQELSEGGCGAICQRIVNRQGIEGTPPLVNASLPPGQWQTYDVVFRAPRFDKDGRKTENARFVKVVHNGKLIHRNTETGGATQSAPYTDEKPTGPLMIQGDHGPVAYRSIRIRSIKLE